MWFRDRRDAGRRLADALESYRGRDDVVVVGLARGGVPVAVEVARSLDLPVDVFAVRKLGAPGQEELAMGAIATGGLRVLNEDVVRALGLERPEIERAVARETVELERRERAYRRDRAPLPLSGNTVIVVDDGIATGSSMEVAVKALRAHGAASVVVAVPTGPRASCERMRSVADDVVCLDTPAGFFAVGQWYDDFRQTSDPEVIALLDAAHQRRHGQAPGEEHVAR
jgi:putative phosphoribosyl transferase